MIVTILTPTLNAERYFADCLRSIRAQTLPRDHIQHLVLDGESTDRTVALAREAGAEVSVARDGSLYEAMNRGIRLARGDVVGWLNADDTFETDALARVVEVLESRPEVEMVVGDFALEADGRRRVIHTRSDALRRARDGIIRKAWVPPIAVFYRTATLRGLGEYQSRYRIAADLDLWLRTAARTPLPAVAHTGGVVGTFRIHEGSLSQSSNPVRSLKERIEISRRWSEDPAAPAGVRRSALHVYRHDAFHLEMVATRGQPPGSRWRRAREVYRELSRLGPGTLSDVSEIVRDEIYLSWKGRRA
jgi:glycosyltransferase involved in cell wall biosynthesis